MANVKLGKKPGRVEDDRHFKLNRFLTALPAAPPSTRIARNAPTPMFANDQYGDCTCAAQAHRVIMQETQAGQKETPLSTRDVLALYSAVTGFTASDPATDQGAYLVDVLRYMRRVGLGRERDGSRHTIGAYVQVNLKKREEVKLATWMFGGLYAGVGLPLTAESQLDSGSTWAVGKGADAEPYSWGGHCMTMDGYSAERVGFRTWGGRQLATWAWFDTYCDEAWAIVSEDFLRASGKTLQGFDLARLNNALSQL